MTQRTPNLWAPWRLEYLQQLPAGGADKNGGCFLCDAADAQADAAAQAQRLVLKHSPHATLLLNRYPYSNGHLLVAPREHVGDLSDLPPAARADLMEMIDLAGRLLRQAVHPQGLNVGANLGRAAGAGVPGHLHWHIVPRWAGDVNFMDVVGQTRVIPQALEESYQTLSAALQKLLR